MSKISPCLWFDDRAEEAMHFYVSIFRNAKAGAVSRYGEGGPKPAGTVMTVAFEIDGQTFIGLNGGPHFTFNEAISFVVNCDTQEEVDAHWDRLSDGGAPGQCGWLKDRFGVSWQIVPSILPTLMTGGDPARAQRVMAAFLAMTKLDIAALQRAAEG